MSFILKNKHQTDGPQSAAQKTTKQDVLLIAVNQFVGHRFFILIFDNYIVIEIGNESIYRRIKVLNQRS